MVLFVLHRYSLLSFRLVSSIDYPLLGNYTKLLVQGITGKQGSIHAKLMISDGTQIVGGTHPSPEKYNHTFLDRPLFKNVSEAVKVVKPNASILFVPPLRAVDALKQSIEARVPLIVCITEGIPQRDMLGVKRYINEIGYDGVLIGPNCPGIIRPGHSKIGIMPYVVHRPGSIAIVSRSGTLTYEAVQQTTDAGLGQSLCVGIGGDPFRGMDFVDALKVFQTDKGTKGIVLIGEIGGVDEEAAAEYIEKNNLAEKYAIVAFIAGRSAPPGKRMGHAGAIVSGGKGTATSKIDALRKAGVTVVDLPYQIGEVLKKRMFEMKLIQ